jgi:glyoxylase-like metal-dependent hydrolase (beta-lactamase superfamily II)
VKVHHLDCCTMHPLGGRLVSGSGSLFERCTLVAHVVAIESSAGLVLVDSGIGTADVAEPERRLGRAFLASARPELDPERTALRQLERLGYRASDVRHIALTHLDLDHAGGLADFPHAKVHVFRAEHEAATNRLTRNEVQRYRPHQWAHGVDWQLHDVAGGERFYGFERVRAIVEPEVLLLPSAGHSRGHAVVAVAQGDGWLVHAGDAYFHHDEVADPPRCPPGLALFQRLVAHDDAARQANQTRLRELKREAGGRVRVFSAHDEEELAAFVGR